MVGTCGHVDRGSRVLWFQRAVLGDAADVSYWHGCCCGHRLDQLDRQSRWLLRPMVCWRHEGCDWGFFRRSLRTCLARTDFRIDLRILPAHSDREGAACCAITSCGICRELNVLRWMPGPEEEIGPVGAHGGRMQGIQSWPLLAALQAMMPPRGIARRLHPLVGTLMQLTEKMLGGQLASHSEPSHAIAEPFLRFVERFCRYRAL